MFNNHSSMRENNTHIVLSQIINHPEISRAMVSKNTGLNKATVSAIVRNLISNDYVIETGTGESTVTGGRKPILLRINKKAGISFSFDVRFDEISYMISYLNGEIIKVASKEMLIDSDNIIPVIENIITDFKSDMKEIPFGIIGITIAIHGIISENNILFTPYYDLSKINLAANLQSKLEVPVYLENEANLAALAEATLDTSHKNIITCSIHTGIGAGIIIDEKLYRGYEGRSGEIGHTTIYPDGVQCPCGNKGCFEQYCSQSSLLKFYHNAKQDKKLSIDDLVSDFNDNDSITRHIIEEFSKNLSIGIINLMGAYGPETVYLNSEIIRKIPVIIDMIKGHLNNTIYNKVPINISKIDKHASLFGATVLNIQNFLGIDSLSIARNDYKLLINTEK